MSKILGFWGALWVEDNSLDGRTERLLCHEGLPAVFRTRRAAQDWIKLRYGYIATRPDLRREPHGWRMPKPVRIKITEDKNGKP